MKEATHTQPMFLLGHSLGGLIATRYVELHLGEVSGLILSSPFFGLAMPIAVPILIVQGQDDRLAEVGCSHRFAGACRAPDLTLRVYGGLFHKSLNELGKERVWQDILDWLETRGGGRDV